MPDAKQALKITEKAINKEPEKWDAYSLEINIYATWSHKSSDFSNNFEGVKFVYEKWLSNGKALNVFQKFGYANTLYCLDDFKNANKFYSEIIKFYKDNEISFEENEREYVIYMLSNIMLYDFDENSFEKIKCSAYDKTDLNEYLFEEMKNINDSGKNQLAERYCNS